ncbi:helix-turn-helix transcriptional regulator [Clostridium butyricum]|uniref:helix-turn-helix transcriptional regulator n=1 Tax=Clostridium butyricum TaxID=1492 RepID=UPI0003D62829|nr:MAG: Helix-turn-helix protein [Clostridium butyricum DORA_1]MDU1509945.1 helix-turn-helix transcriptional regulator [Clostridium butyricum]MDU4802298.1 helix-turn-helix transcriptional regulator [Clostridium butyricum]
MRYKTTSIPKTCKINIRAAEIEQLKNETKTIGFWLRYHRLSINLSMQALTDELGLSYPSYIKNLEDSLAFPSRDVSMKLAEYFKLDRKYFYDPYFEDTDDYDKKLYNYRIINNLTIDAISERIGIAHRTWYSWERKKSAISRRNYLKLKEIGIL